MSDIASDTDSSHMIRSKQVAPLPIGSGGSSTIKNHMNDMNTQLTMMASQATVDTKYDPPPPKHMSEQVIRSGFCSQSQLSLPDAIGLVGGLFIVYGIIAK